MLSRALTCTRQAPWASYSHQRACGQSAAVRSTSTSWPEDPSRVTPRSVLAVVNADPMTERVSWRQAAARTELSSADDVDNRTDDLIRSGADRGEHRSGVGSDLVNLQVDISGADQRTERIERALPCKERETPGLDDCDVMVAGWVVQLCWVVASDHRGHAAHPAPPEKPDATQGSVAFLLTKPF